MSKRIKYTATAPATREEMECLVGEIALLKTAERAAKADMDEEIKACKDGFLTTFTEIEERLAVLLPQARAWAEFNPAEFGKAKSIAMLHGTIGWRLNTPSLKTAAGWTWDRVLEKIQAMGAAMSGFVRTKEEVNKQLIIDRRDDIGADALKSIGLRIVQEDEFYVEPNHTETAKIERTA